MMTPLTLETIAHDLVAQRVAEAERHALIAQLPRSPKPLVTRFAVGRANLANGLRSIARRLDPTFVVPERASADHRLVIARSR
ncbi:MAG TPA: hypothetical protein VGL99_25980 [Chloroflexota bacterium]|jgi:hypothetical protein